MYAASRPVVTYMSHLPSLAYDVAWLLVWQLQDCRSAPADLAAAALQPCPVLQRHANHMSLDPAHSLGMQLCTAEVTDCVTDSSGPLKPAVR